MKKKKKMKIGQLKWERKKELKRRKSKLIKKEKEKKK